MYDIPYFKADNNSEVIAFMKAHPFVILCGCGNNGLPVATHVPVLLEEREGKLFLQGHVMREQHHTKAFEQNSNVLAVFSGAHTYVSASWYKQQNIASTWNYQAVHAQGIIRFLNEEALYELLVKLTEHYESEQSPALVKHMKPGYVRSLMQYIVAFEIEITHIEHVFKLSQNRDEQSYENIVHHLQEQDNEDARQIAAAMLQRKQNQ